MQYTETIRIGLQRDRVAALFGDPANLPRWQKGLLSFTHAEGPPGHPGATSHIVYQMGRRRIEMTETILVSDLPEHFAATYETRGVWNRVDNRFRALPDGTTEWELESDFRCTGVLWLMALLMPGMFRKQTAGMMADFKRFAENADAAAA
jgi:hypothetical protein